MATIKRLLPLLALVASLALCSSALAAVDILPTSPASVTGSATTTPTFITITPASGPRVALQCTSVSDSFTASTNTTAGFPTRTAPDFFLSFSTCRFAGVPFTASCGVPGLVYVSGLTAASLTPGYVQFLRCSLRFTGCSGTQSLSFSTQPFSFNNSSPQRFRLSGTGQSGSVTSTCSYVPSGTAALSSVSTGPSDVVFTVSPATTIIGY